MTTTYPGPGASHQGEAFSVATHPNSGTEDDDDDRDDEKAGENEALVRETDDQTEAPEEFRIDDEDTPGDAERSDDDEAS